MDNFMDRHPEIAEQLRKDPSLVDNRQFVADHPDLQKFLADHPGMSEEYRENPNAFMRDEGRFDRREDAGNGMRRSGDISRDDLVYMDNFMDRHPEIAEQLRKDPSLVDNRQFVADHPDLQKFLADHPGMSEEYRENPNAFMRDEGRFDRREDAGNGMHRDRDVNEREIASFNEFMGNHDKIADDVSKNPSLASNQEYLENHPELKQYLNAHPEVHQQLNDNPQQFLASAKQFNTHTAPKATGDPKLPK